MDWMAKVHFLVKTVISFFATTYRLVPRPTQTPTLWVLGVISKVVKQPKQKGDLSFPFTAKNNNAWNFTFTSPHTFMEWSLSKMTLQFT
jgi:hypothetical protein